MEVQSMHQVQHNLSAHKIAQVHSIHLYGIFGNILLSVTAVIAAKDAFPLKPHFVTWPWLQVNNTSLDCFFGGTETEKSLASLTRSPPHCDQSQIRGEFRITANDVGNF